MPSLQIQPPREPSPRPQHPTPARTTTQPSSRTSVATTDTNTASSPVAPSYSPITPKVLPALPAAVRQQAFVPPPDNGGSFSFTAPTHQSEKRVDEAQQSVIPPTQYIPQPPALPFSAEDATDAIALRAAISTLQFQKRKAQEDIHLLKRIREQALEDPEHYKTELLAGRLKEQRPKVGDIQAILDHAGEGDDEDEVVLGASQVTEDMNSPGASEWRRSPAEIPDSQPLHSASKEQSPTAVMDIDDGKKPFPQIPGPQDVVRMPYVNWDKYHVVGEALDSMHEQQRRWPGNTAYGTDRGREYTIAAPYSPFLDHLDSSGEAQGLRKDSAASPGGHGGISEHPMETRSRT